MKGSSNTGITKLLAAESEAAGIVSEARQYRVTKLKQAKEAAAEAIEEFRQSMEKDLLSSSKADTSISKYAEELDMETRRSKEEIESDFHKHKEEIVSILMAAATTVKTDVPQSLSESLQAMSN